MKPSPSPDKDKPEGIRGESLDVVHIDGCNSILEQAVKNCTGLDDSNLLKSLDPVEQLQSDCDDNEFECSSDSERSSIEVICQDRKLI